MSDPNFKSGDVLSAIALNEHLRQQQLQIRGGPGIHVRSSDGRQIQIAASFTGLFVGKASGAITARDDLTFGTGDVELYVKDPSTGDYIDSGILLKDCDNLSSTTGGIPDDTWVAGFFQDDGTPTITTADCGNP